MSRKRIVWVIGIAILMSFGFVSSDTQAEPNENSQLTLRVVVDPGSLELAFADVAPFGTPNPGAAFYIFGDICADPTPGEPCDEVIGEFQCWGWQVNPTGNPAGPANFALVSQEFKLFGRGKIQAQGVEDEGPRAVTGGTGEFNNVRGEATGSDLSAFPPEFIISFKLKGAGK